VALRCGAEWGTNVLISAVSDPVKVALCAARGYDPDDFESALEATRGRVRLPFGWTALDVAWRHSQREPIRLLDAALAGKRVPTSIAGIARQLQFLRKDEPILLPIDQIRALLEQRKIVVSGAVQRLVEARLLDYADRNYHTGKARDFHFTDIEGQHYEKVSIP
jgi:hypothetical protein